MQSISTILIIDDDPLGREALDVILYAPNYRLLAAANGPEGLALAAQTRPDLILLDVMMPGMDGYEVCQRIRNNPELAEVPIIMITALDDRASRLRGIDAGADDFVTKPIDSVELRTRVQAITRLNRYRRLLDERHRFEWVIEQAEEGYLLLTGQDEIRYANPSARRYFGLEDASLDQTEVHFLDIAYSRYTCEPSAAWANWSTRAVHSSEPLWLIIPATESIPATWLQVTVLDQAASTEKHRLVRIRDVTERIDTQQSMWTFQAMVRHKLNTPMHIILGSLELLRMQSPDEIDPDELAEVVEWMASGMQRLQGSIADILRYVDAPLLAQTDAGFQLSHFPALLDRLSAMLDLQKVSLQEDSALMGALALSNEAVECIVSELLENARKFHPDHEPTIGVFVAPAGPQVVEIKFLDDGVNLSLAQLDRIWTPYYQGESTFSGEMPGMGLGLSTVRTLVWKVGGACRVTNRNDGPGIAVELTIPLQ